MLSDWERSDTLNGIPFYINHKTEQTFWDHPRMTEVYSKLKSFDYIKYSAYRIACKIQKIRKATLLYQIDLKTLSDYFEIRNFGANADLDLAISVPELSTILSDLYELQQKRKKDLKMEPSVAAELALNWVLNVFDSSRSELVNVLSVKIGLAIMVFGSVSAKYYYIFSQIKSADGILDRNRVTIFLATCLLIPKHFGEGHIFGRDALQLSVQHCLDRGHVLGEITLTDFMKWAMGDPRLLVWIPTLHRFSVAETTHHEAKCNVCKVFPIVGFRYKCLKCFNVDLCQECFWTARVWKRHKLTHPIQEYCQSSKQSQDVKDVARIMKNKMIHGGKSDKKKEFREPVENEEKVQNLEDSKIRDAVDIPVDEADNIYAEPLSQSSPTKHRKSSKILNGSKKSHSKRSSIFSSGQGSSSYDARPLPDDKANLAMSANMQPKMRPDQTAEMERIIEILEKDNSMMEKELEETKKEQIDYRSKTTVNEIKSLRDDKRILQARQSILEDHNRVLEMQLLKMRMLLQQGNTDETSLSKTESRLLKVDNDKCIIVAPNNVNGPSAIKYVLEIGTQCQGGKQSEQHPLRIQEEIRKSSKNVVTQTPRRHMATETTTPSFFDMNDKKRDLKKEFENAIDSAFATFPTKAKAAKRYQRHGILESADALSKAMERTLLSKDIYQYCHV